MTKNSKRRAAVYLDATILSCLHDNRPALAYPASITRRWWRTERKNFRLYLSSETIAELAAGVYPAKVAALRDARRLELLPRVAALEAIIQRYITAFVMPRDDKGDAAHLAYASFYRMDYLLTWNCNRLANANKEAHIRVVNGRLGLATPRIITPLELFEETSA